MANYAETFPAELERLWALRAPAIVPWGALEWHGHHLPLGLDGIVAEQFASMLAERSGGVLLPTVWLPITTLPHPASLQVQTTTLRLVLDDLLAELFRAGARTVAIVTGHYAQAHLLEMYEAALRAMEDHPGLLVLAATPLQLLDDPDLLDHAARYETSQLLAIRPDLVRLEALPDRLNARDHAVLGEHPMSSSAHEGQTLLERALGAWEARLAAQDRPALFEHYAREFDILQPYVDQYFEGSWDDALDKWWAQRIAREEGDA